MNEEQQTLWEYLRNNAIGYDARRSSTEIREDCGFESGGVTNEHVRDLIRDMILNHNCCIGSIMWVDGYWIVQNEHELEMSIKSLMQRANGVIKRADALRANFLNRNDG